MEDMRLCIDVFSGGLELGERHIRPWCCQLLVSLLKWEVVTDTADFFSHILLLHGSVTMAEQRPLS